MNDRDFQECWQKEGEIRHTDSIDNMISDIGIHFFMQLFMQLSSFPDYPDETRRQHEQQWLSEENRKGDAPLSEF